MRLLKLLTVLVLLGSPALAYADIDGIPGSATWYFHSDFDAMRSGKASRELYDWLDAEVFQDILSETGIDFGKDARRLTAFSRPGQGPVIVLEGNISQDTRDKVLAIATAAAGGDLKTFKSSGKVYYFFEGDGADTGDIDIDIESLEKEAYLSLALKDKILITNTQDQMKALLANNGKLEAPKNDKNALFVLRADRSLIQAGVNANQLNDDSGWDSNILRNTRQVAVLIADLGEKLGIEAQLMANEPEMANSLASIARGLISLQAFNDEMDSDVTSILKSITVDVVGSTLKLSLLLDPETVVSALED